MLSGARFSTNDLYEILACKNQDALQQCALSKRKVLQLKYWLAKISQRNASHKIFHSILSVITEGPGYPLYVWGLIIGLIQVGVIPLTILTSALFLFLFVSGGIYFGVSYKDFQIREQNADKKQSFLLLQLACVDEIIERKQAELKNFSRQFNQPDITVPIVIPKKDFSQKIKEKKTSALKQALSTTLIMTTILFETYYLSTYTIIAALGLTSIAAPMIGLVGIGIAVGAIAAVSIVLGCLQYRMIMQEEIRHREMKNIQHEFEVKKEICYQLRGIQNDVAKKIKPIARQPQPFVMRAPKSLVRFGMYPYRLFSNVKRSRSTPQAALASVHHRRYVHH